MSSLLIENPSVSGPKIHFGNQTVVNGVAGLYPDTPSIIPGSDDDSWNLIEWSNQQTLDPSSTIANLPSSYDQSLGQTANYSLTTADGETAFYSYDTSQYGWVYRIIGTGTTTDLGEHDVFFSNAQPLSVNMAGDEVDLSLSSRVLSENTDPENPGDPDFYSESLIGLTFNYNLSTMPGYIAGQPTVGAFIQIALSGTGSVDATQSYFSLTSDGASDTVISNQLRTENPLDVVGNANLTQGSYNITAYLNDLTNYLSGEPQFGPSVKDLSLWDLGGLYTGVQTQGERTHIDAEFANLQLTRADSASTASLELSPENSQLNIVTNVIDQPGSTADGGSSGAASSDGGASNTLTYDVFTDGSGGAEYSSTNQHQAIALSSSNGVFTLPDGSQGYFDSSGNGEDVARIFEATLGRQADALGISEFTAPVNAKSIGLVDAAQGFLNSSEYQNTNGNPTNGDFVEKVFENVLGRSDNSDTYYTGMLSSGVSKAAVLVAIATSAEAIVHNQSWDGSDQLGQDYREFQTIFGRPADTTTLSWMQSVTNSGVSQAGMVSALLTMPEGQARYGSLSPTAIVMQLYQNGLNRTADAGGLQQYSNELSNGGSANSVVMDIANSGEARGLFAPTTHANWVST